MKKIFFITFVLSLSYFSFAGEKIFLETENFTNKGGWVVDQQFMDLMGSPYLMAHGLGTPVEDAYTTVDIPKNGTYYIYVRTFNWTSPWYDGEGPGKFMISVNGKELQKELGITGNEWQWESAGEMPLKKGATTVLLRDLTGFNGRCDAVYLTSDKNDVPPSDLSGLALFRKQMLRLPAPQNNDNYDLIVAGGGVAGICAAVSAARLGCKVALINDRPVLGGNNSSEIRVHLGGRIETGRYKELGNLIKEFGPTRGGNAQPGEFYEDEKKSDIISKEENIDLFPNYRIVDVIMDGKKIRSVLAKHIETGEELLFSGHNFADCTGDGTVGFLAGADYHMGREAHSEFGEKSAPEVGDKMTMGASVQWYSVEKDKDVNFPEFNYGVSFNENNCEKVMMGEWTWETGMNFDQVGDFERIRDYGLLVVYSNWSFLKNKLKNNEKYKDRALGWVAYISGKRESRRLLGDYILNENDLTEFTEYKDGSAATTWTIDLHYPDPENTKNFPNAEFKSIAKHIGIYPYPIPYRCLYSRNIDNLFMAGRNISVTHVALGTVRVMRTTGMMGEVVGMAASLCKEHKAYPRDVYRSYLNELQDLMKNGTGKQGLPNNQQYNEGGSLSEPPQTATYESSEAN